MKNKEKVAHWVGRIWLGITAAWNGFLALLMGVEAVAVLQDPAGYHFGSEAMGPRYRSMGIYLTTSSVTTVALLGCLVLGFHLALRRKNPLLGGLVMLSSLAVILLMNGVLSGIIAGHFETCEFFANCNI